MLFYRMVIFLATNILDGFHRFPYASVIASHSGVLGMAYAEHKNPVAKQVFQKDRLRVTEFLSV